VTVFGSPWVSDHLSFNQTPEFATGFFLPPRQTLAGVETACSAIRDLQEALGLPILVEVGANYLHPRADELADGEFIARVIEQADCGLLLDMHNIFANSLNGRQPIDDFLESVPLERVWEIHLAGGMELDGFYLDAHSGAIPDALYAVTERLVPRLPNLCAMIFEIFPSFIPLVGLDLVREQLERMHLLWQLRRPQVEVFPRRVSFDPVWVNPAPPEAWERALGALVIGRPATQEPLAQQLANDPGVRLVEGLVHEFRASMIVGVLRLTSRLLMLSLGPEGFRTLLQSHWAVSAPQLYAGLEAEKFAAHLVNLSLGVPHLYSLLSFECAVMAVLTDGETRIVTFDFEPLPMLRALAEGRLPSEPAILGHYEIELTPDGPIAATGVTLVAAQQAYPFH
jgi:uncharacterized protein